MEKSKAKYLLSLIIQGKCVAIIRGGQKTYYDIYRKRRANILKIQEKMEVIANSQIRLVINYLNRSVSE